MNPNPFLVKVPSDPYENTTVWNRDEAISLCYNLSLDYGHAHVCQYEGPYLQDVAEFYYGS